MEKNLKINGFYYKKNDKPIEHHEREMLIRDLMKVVKKHGFEFFGYYNFVSDEDVNLLDLNLKAPKVRS
ncbi:hypothetical protein PP178_02925 [Zeaxanthinibacter sp. PT1]|uniref:hypothetical protein n=1 Tax=Zeaxanthinibacter TaxID=561554 RepID=UPI00234AE6F0|nr:hypothetical protein [Zeaxanthinibacter sp. PT1]MDC6350490.1 hypothetical protein [Zeaxanthinibacter sp. PT1]